MTAAHKLSVKIGDAEFSSEGSQEVVNEQFQQFLTALNAVARTPPSAPPAPPSAEGGTGGPEGTVRALGNGGGVGPDILSQAFIDQNGYVSLRSLPVTNAREADSLLMILYGYRALQGAQDVTAVSLAESARQSGFNLPRLDRILATYTPQYIRRGGARRSTRYSLNNQGVAQAESLLREMYE